MKKNEKQNQNSVPSEEKNTEKKKMSRFGKLYIATAICTACVCLLVIGFTTHVSRSILRWDENTPINVPTPAPIDSLIDGTLSLPSAAPAIRITDDADSVPVSDAVQSDDEKDVQQENIETTQSVQTGLFKKEEPITLRMPISGEILNECSLDRLKKSKTFGDWRTHNGMDIKADSATAVNAAASGTVIRSEYDNLMGYVVVIEHEGGYETLYANLASNEMVEVGQKINVGECIGAVGDSAVFEKLEESHLHFELKKDGKYLNPSEYIN